MAVHDPGQDGREIQERGVLLGVGPTHSQHGNLPEVGIICLNYRIDEMLFIVSLFLLLLVLCYFSHGGNRSYSCSDHDTGYAVHGHVALGQGTLDSFGNTFSHIRGGWGFESTPDAPVLSV